MEVRVRERSYRVELQRIAGAERPRPTDARAERPRPTDARAERPRPVDARAEGPQPADARAQADGREWLVVVDDRRCRVNLVRSGQKWSLLMTGPAGSASSRSLDVVCERSLSGDFLVHVDGTIVPVSLPGRLGGPTRRAGRGGTGSHGGRVVAPMPGRVVSVLVEQGDEVSERQGVIVLEAMKMQNEVRAGRAGVVTEVRVTRGSAVDAGTVLVVIGDSRTVERS